jgi:ketosteroid isomerase-like protein
MTPSDTVRAAFERFNTKDFDGALDLFHPDAELADLLREGVTHRGRDVIRELWTERFAQASAHALIYELFAQGTSVAAVVRYQAYGPDGAPCGSPMVVFHRFAFDEDRIVRVQATIVEALADDAKALFLQPS